MVVKADLLVAYRSIPRWHVPAWCPAESLYACAVKGRRDKGWEDDGRSRGREERSRGRRTGSGGSERKVPKFKHLGGKAGGEGGGLDVEVSEHGIRAPASGELDDICVNTGAQEGHGTGGAQRARFDVGGLEAVGGAIQGDGFAEEGGDGAHSEVMPNAAREPGVERSVGWGAVGAQVHDAADGGQDGAEEVMATAAVADFFSGDSVLLEGEGEDDVGGRGKAPGRSVEEVEAGLANIKVDIGQPKRGGQRRIRGQSVFSGTAEKVQSNADYIAARLEKGGGGLGVLGGTDKDGHRDGFDPGRCRVGQAIATEHGAQPVVEFARVIISRVRGPQ